MDDEIPNRLSSFGTEIGSVILYLTELLKQKDRVLWYLTRLKAYLILNILKEESDGLSAEATQALKSKLNNLPNINKQEIEDISRGLDDEDIKHFLSLPINKIQAFPWKPETSWQEIKSNFEAFEKEWQDKQGEYIPKSPDDNILIDFGDGNAWVYVDKSYCTVEAAAMGHCGNQGNPKPNDRILSFRTTEVDANGNELWHPQMTFILDIETGMLGETKGRLNGKPGSKYHRYILELLKNPKIKGIKGGGYKPENNFFFDDLNKEQREEFWNARPDISDEVSISRLKNRIEYRNPIIGLHREGGPAVENSDGSKEWYINGKPHREDGPAIESSDGSKEWLLNGKLHREDGPAIEYPDGDKYWFINGKRHREDGPAIEYPDGSKEWHINGKLLYKINTSGTKLYYNEDESLLHRKDGPAAEYTNGDKKWYINGKLHREDGPAIELVNGTKEWYINGKLHREDGPAVEYTNGDKKWYINGNLHREDGPAIEYSDGTKQWHLNGRRIGLETWMDVTGNVVVYKIDDKHTTKNKSISKILADLARNNRVRLDPEDDFWLLKVPKNEEKLDDIDKEFSEYKI